MVKVHEGGKVYRVTLRALYGNIRSEKDFRMMVERGIVAWERKCPEYGKALRTKSLWEVCSLFGIITMKREIKD